MSQSWVLLARSADHEVLVSLVSCAVSAAVAGVEVRIVWEGAALRSLVADDLEPDAPTLRALARVGRPPASEILREAETLGLRHFACSAAALLAGTPAEVTDRVDDVVGWPTVVTWIAAADRVLTF